MACCENSSFGDRRTRGLGIWVVLAGFGLFALRGVALADALRPPTIGGAGYSPSQGLSGAGVAPDYLRARSAADVAVGSRGSAFTGGGQTRKSQGRQFAGSGFGSDSGTRLLGGRSNYSLYSSYSRYARPGTFLDALRLVSRGYVPIRGMNQGTLSETGTRFASWGVPEMVAKRSEVALVQTQPADAPGVSSGTPKLTLQQLVKNGLDGRRAVCEARALEAFKAGRYHEACDQLALADATAIEEPDQRVYLKLLFCYAALAAQQYQECFNALAWVMARDYKDGGRSVPAALKRLRDVASLYGNPKEFADQVALLEKSASSNREARDDQALRMESALRALAAWGARDPANAKFHAHRAEEFNQRVGEKGERTQFWSRLEGYMAAAEQDGDGTVFVPVAPVETEIRPAATTRPGLLTLEAVPMPAAK